MCWSYSTPMYTWDTCTNNSNLMNSHTAEVNVLRRKEWWRNNTLKRSFITSTPRRGWATEERTGWSVRWIASSLIASWNLPLTWLLQAASHKAISICAPALSLISRQHPGKIANDPSSFSFSLHPFSSMHLMRSLKQYSHAIVTSMFGSADPRWSNPV